jgi:hypothetical protein
MTTAQAQTLGPLLTGALLAALAACGGSNGPTGMGIVPTPTPTPCSQAVIASNNGPVLSKYVVLDPFSVASTGRLDVTVDWTVSSSLIGVYVVPANNCATIEQFNARSCNFLVRSDSGPKPRKISTPGFAAGSYDLLLANFGSVDESLSYQIVLSQGSCAPLAGGAPAASQAGESMTVSRIGRLH